MSKYIDKINAENKTLTAKYNETFQENLLLQEENLKLKKQIHDLTEQNRTLERKKCTHNKMCESLSDGLKGIMGTMNILNNN